MDLTGPKLIGWTEVELIGPNGVEVDLIGPHRNNLILERTNYLQQILEKKKTLYNDTNNYLFSYIAWFCDW